MSTKEQFVDIVGADSKYSLVAQIFDWDHDLHDRNTFQLRLRNTATGQEVLIQTLITGIHVVGIADTKFQIHGMIAGERIGWDESFWMEQYPWLQRFLQFVAHYDTRSRKGNIKSA